MALKETILDDLPDPGKGVSDLIRDTQKQKDNRDFESSKTLLFRLGIVFCILVLFIAWVILPVSRVMVVSVEGNTYLSTEYIRELSGIEKNDRYFFVLPFRVTEKLNEDPMIADSRVDHLRQNIIRITVEEEVPLGYRYGSDGPVILLSTSQIIPMTSSYLPVIARIPYIEGFEGTDETRKLITALKKIDRKMIEEITEIRQYPLSYDAEAMELQMRDGSYFFTNYYAVEAVNSYHDIYVRMNDHSQCIYADTSADRAYSGACPWNAVPVEHEYWTDENGNFLYNQYGDPAVKHYYTDNAGHYYLDDSGNRIVVPINEFNADVYDNDFLNHYLNGFYSTGVLVFPEEVPPEGIPEEEAPAEEGSTTE